MRRIRTLRTRTGNERGQALPLFAVSAVAILALIGLGLDGSRVFLERRDAQSAADLAALTAARLLPGDAEGARDLAVAVAAANGFTIDRNLDVTTPYDGDAGKIHVDVPSDVPMLFTAVIGITNTPVNAYAVAKHSEATVAAEATALAGPAILSWGQECSDGDNLKWDAHNTTIYGDVVTNSGGDINGSNNIMNPDAQYNQWWFGQDCGNQLHIDPAQNPDPQFTLNPNGFMDYPLDHNAQPFADPLADESSPDADDGGICNIDYMASKGYTVIHMETDEPPYASGTTLAPAVYCRVNSVASPTVIQEKINIKTQYTSCPHEYGVDPGISGGCTFVSLLIQSSAADTSLAPLVRVAPATGGKDQTVCDASDATCGYPLLTYAPPGSDKQGINFSGARQLWNGVMFSPTGLTHYTGHDAAIYNGAVWSFRVDIIGSGFTLNGPALWGGLGPGAEAQPEYLGLIE